MTESTDPEILDRVLARTEWARQIARSLLEDDAGADDVVQDAMLAVIRRPPSSANAVASWLRQVIRNGVFETHRGRRRRALREIEAARPEAEMSAADLVARAALQKELVARVLELEEPYRGTVLLRYFGDKTAKEIADAQGIPAATVRVRLSRALDMLRRRLEADRPEGRWRSGLLTVMGVGSTCGTKVPVTAPVAHAAGSFVFSKTHLAAMSCLVLLLVTTVQRFLAGGPEEIVVELEPIRTTMEDTAARRHDGAKTAPLDVRRATESFAPETTTAFELLGCSLYVASAQRSAIDLLVLGIDSRPISDVEVAVNSIVVGRTDASGRFEICGTKRSTNGREADVVEARHASSAATRIVVEAEQSAATMQLRPYGSLTVKVVDEAGRVVPGADVRIETLEDPRIVRLAATTSDIGGVARFEHLPAVLTTIVATAAGAAPTSKSVELWALKDREVLLELSPAREVTIRIVDGMGRGIVGAEVALLDTMAFRRPNRMSDGSGWVRFDDVSTHVSGLHASIRLPGAASAVSRPLDLPLTESVERVMVFESQTITLRLLDVDGRPHGGRLRIEVPGGESYTADYAGEDAGVTFRGLAATLHVASADLHGTRILHRPLTELTTKEPATFDLRLPPLVAFAAHLADASGSVVRGRVALRTTNPEWHDAPFGAVEFTADVEPDGYARFEVPKGRYLLRAFDGPREVHRVDGFEIDGSMKHSIVVPAPAFVEGRLVDDRGNPLGNWKVFARSDARGSVATTNLEGRFALPVEAALDVELGAESPRFQGTISLGRSAIGSPSRDFIVRFGGVRFHVRDQDGRGVAWQVNLRLSETTFGPVTPRRHDVVPYITDDAGYVDVELPFGEWTAWAHGDQTTRARVLSFVIDSPRIEELTFHLDRTADPKIVFRDSPGAYRKLRFKPVNGTPGPITEFTFPRPSPAAMGMT